MKLKEMDIKRKRVLLWLLFSLYISIEVVSGAHEPIEHPTPLRRIKGASRDSRKLITDLGFIKMEF